MVSKPSAVVETEAPRGDLDFSLWRRGVVRALHGAGDYLQGLSALLLHKAASVYYFLCFKLQKTLL